MHLCIIYKAHYNLAMLPLLVTMLHLPQPKPETITLNTSCPTTAKICSNTLSYLLNSGVGMPSHRWQWRLHPWNCSKPASHMLHTNITLNYFYPALSGLFLFVKLLQPSHEVWAKVLFYTCLSVHRGVSV